MELKPIDRTDRAVRRLHAALSIYRDTILPEAQNPERQILYWIEHSKDNLADEFRCFAIQSQGSVVGYLQYSYFREEHIFFFEYLCIRDPNTSGLVPSAAVKAIETFLAENYRPNFTIVFEVAEKRDPEGEWRPDKKLVAYFRRLGFREVEFKYRYPILQSYDGGLSYPATLMILLPSRRTTVTAHEMRTILRCIYFKHYLRWDRPFLDAAQFAHREKLIDRLYSEEVSRLDIDKDFGTRGDDKRSLRDHFAVMQPKIGLLLQKLFGPKMPRLLTTMLIMLFAQWLVGSIWVLVPLAVLAAAYFCLAEDTDTSRKLFVTIISRFHLARPRSL
jgi:hypothetical protein